MTYSKDNKWATFQGSSRTETITPPNKDDGAAVMATVEKASEQLQRMNSMTPGNQDIKACLDATIDCRGDLRDAVNHEVHQVQENKSPVVTRHEEPVVTEEDTQQNSFGMRR